LAVISLTGGLASGKSTAAKYLGDKGAFVIDADVLGHRAYDPGTQAYQEVVATFGDELVSADGQIDRKVLGGKVFGKPEELKKLTDIVWPEIRRQAESAIRAALAEQPNRLVILEAAVLFEAGWDDIAEENWVVVVEPAIAVQRAIARDGFDQEAVQKRLDSQLSNAERSAQADHIINNSGELADMLAQLDAELTRLQS